MPFFGLAQLLQNTTGDEEHFTLVPKGIDREISCHEIQAARDQAWWFLLIEIGEGISLLSKKKKNNTGKPCFPML